MGASAEIGGVILITNLVLVAGTAAIGIRALATATLPRIHYLIASYKRERVVNCLE